MFAVRWVHNEISHTKGLRSLLFHLWHNAVREISIAIVCLEVFLKLIIGYFVCLLELAILLALTLNGIIGQVHKLVRIFE